MNEFEDRLTVIYPEDSTLDVQVAYAEFVNKLRDLKGSVKIEEIALIENEGGDNV